MNLSNNSSTLESQIRPWKCIHTLTGHSAWVRTVAIRGDGQILISGSQDKTIKIWHGATGKLLYTLVGHAFRRGMSVKASRLNTDLYTSVNVLTQI